jgi:MFS family permease
LLGGIYIATTLMFVEGFVSWLLFRMGVVALLMIPSTIFGLVLVDAALCAIPAGYISAKITWTDQGRTSLIYCSLSTLLSIAFFLAVLLLVLATQWVMFAVLVRVIPLSVAIALGAGAAVFASRRNASGDPE